MPHRARRAKLTIDHPGFVTTVQPRCIPEFIAEATARRGDSQPGLEIRVIAGGALSREQVACWHEIQQANPELRSPFFAPEFTQAVASVRQDVEVAILEKEGRIQGFFPYQRRGEASGIPVGGIVSDYQGLICAPGLSLDPRAVLKACHLTSWKFDRLICSQQFFIPYYRKSALSARIDLSEGYLKYASQRRAAGSRQIKQCEYMMRRLEREIGPLRFVAHSPDPKLLNKVLAWKSEQYRRTGWNDLFATRWGRALVEQIHSIQNSDFGGALSLLFAGRQLVAGHLGMRAGTIWQYWFPAYDRRFAKYSPGLILLLRMAQCAQVYGISAIDIGTGLSLYKTRLMNASIPVAEGSVETSACAGVLRVVKKLRSWIRRA